MNFFSRTFRKFYKKLGLILFSLYLKSISCKNRALTQFSTTFESLFNVAEIYLSNWREAFIKSDLNKICIRIWLCKFGLNQAKSVIYFIAEIFGGPDCNCSIFKILKNLRNIDSCRSAPQKRQSAPNSLRTEMKPDHLHYRNIGRKAAAHAGIVQG